MCATRGGEFLGAELEGLGAAGAEEETAAANAESGFAQWNKVHHIFDDPGHGLGSLIEQYGTKEAAYNALQQAANEQILPKGITGVFKNQVISVGGTEVTVSGNVMNGAVRMGTVFRPGFQP